MGEFQNGISNADLRVEQVPDRGAGWAEIWEFALTFDGYERWGSSEKCAEIANSRRHDTLTDLRTCLFFEQRRYHHFGETPRSKDEQYVRGLLSAIRARLTAGDRS